MKLKHSSAFALLIICASAFTFKSINSHKQSKMDNLSTKEWISMEDALTLAKVDQKKILVDVYTDWCKWCKVMDQKTLSNPEISDFLSENFHLVKFNAEQKEALTFNEKEFKYIENGRRGQHEFAIEILNGQMSYPSLVVFDSDLKKLDVIRGYKTVAELTSILK